MINCHYYMPDLPAVPKHLIEQALSITDNFKSNLDKLVSDRTALEPEQGYYIDDDGKKYTNRSGLQLDIGKEWQQWLTENVSSQWRNTGVSVSWFNAVEGLNDSKSASFHTDGERNFCLFYIIKKDNDDQWTKWYRPTTGPLVHDKKMVYYNKLIKQGELFTIGDEKFELIDEVVMPLYTLIYTDVRILHQAGNHLGQRIGIQVSFQHDEFDLFAINDQLNKEQQW